MNVLFGRFHRDVYECLVWPLSVGCFMNVLFGDLHKHFMNVLFGDLHKHFMNVLFGDLHKHFMNVLFGDLHKHFMNVLFGDLHKHFMNVLFDASFNNLLICEMLNLLLFIYDNKYSLNLFIVVCI